MGKGDSLASGASKASFPPAGGNVSQSKWDDIFGVNSGPKKIGSRNAIAPPARVPRFVFAGNNKRKKRTRRR
jgi:hypothetical protein